jgi:hypothetical protein
MELEEIRYWCDQNPFLRKSWRFLKNDSPMTAPVSYRHQRIVPFTGDCLVVPNDDFSKK